MKYQLKIIFFFLTIFGIITFSIYCDDPVSTEGEVGYLNLHDSVRYVGMDKCRNCHAEIYDSFVETGMGQSFHNATKEKSAANFTGHPLVYDKFRDFYYHPYWDADTFKIKEFRLNGRDTAYQRIEVIDYIVGSGQHTNSHIINRNEYFYQAPLTFYTQSGKWDLPPGFESGNNSRFTRKIGLECMSCHNAFPEFVQGSENKFNAVPVGIDCERCHGPGELHVKEKLSGNFVDTSKFIDHTIVNPGKLSADLQFDLCQRCHLQGNAVLKEGKSFFDFKPGMRLSEVMTLFLPKYENGEDEFIMASHAERLKLSKCFLETEKQGSKENGLTCISCHNPHVSVKQTGNDVFNGKCRSCHSESDVSADSHFCTLSKKEREEKNNDCVNCHMPASGSIDIPHVRIHDHYIKIPEQEEKTEKIKKFLGLFPINEDDPDSLIIARGYINQFEKFDPDPQFLDSASAYIDWDKLNEKGSLALWIHLMYLKSEFDQITGQVNRTGKEVVTKEMFIKPSWDNQDGWTLYRIGESYMSTNKPMDAVNYFALATRLAPHNTEFKNKYASGLSAIGMNDKAKNLFEEITIEDPGFAPAWSNLGYLIFMEGNLSQAEKMYNHALSLDPDYIPALMNKMGMFYASGKKYEAREILEKVLKLEPEHPAANSIFETYF